MRERVLRWIGLLSFAACAFALGATSLVEPGTAIVLGALPAAALAVYLPRPFLVAAVAVLPYSTDLTGGRLGGVNIAASDLLLMLGFVGVLAHLIADGSARAWLTSLRPMLGPVALYAGALILSVSVSPSTQGIVTVLQRMELVVVTLVAGAYLAHVGSLRRALTSFVVFASVLAVFAILTVIARGTGAEGFLGVQKNPAGQAIAGALLVVVSARYVPVRALVAGPLAVGLLASLSRGAILAAAVGLVVLAALQGAGSRLRQGGLAVGLGVLVVLAFNALPSEQQERLVDVSPETDYATAERERYADDAWTTVESAPFTGVGPGNYAGGDLAPGIADPHNVLLLEAAEGGVVLAAAFVILVVGSLVVLVRRRHRHPLVVTAIAVQVATVLHGMVDVYWVRGTPVLGWVLVGAALAVSHRRQVHSTPTPEREGSSR